MADGVNSCPSWRLNAARSTPGVSFNSMRDSLPSRSKRHCAAPISIIAMRCPARALTKPPATRNVTKSTPDCRRNVSPASTFSHSIAAGDRKMVSSAKVSKGLSFADTPIRSGAMAAAVKTSRPRIFKALRSPGTVASISRTGLASAIWSCCASVAYRASSNSGCAPRTCRSDWPDKVLTAAENSLKAAALIRWMAKPSATPNAMAPMATMARTGWARHSPPISQRPSCDPGNARGIMMPASESGSMAPDATRFWSGS